METVFKQISLPHSEQPGLPSTENFPSLGNPTPELTGQDFKNEHKGQGKLVKEAR